MADVVALFDHRAVDEAWAEFEAVARRAVDQPHLLLNREFHQDYIAKHQRFRELYERQVRQQRGAS